MKKIKMFLFLLILSSIFILSFNSMKIRAYGSFSIAGPNRFRSVEAVSNASNAFASMGYSPRYQFINPGKLMTLQHINSPNMYAFYNCCHAGNDGFETGMDANNGLIRDYEINAAFNFVYIDGCKTGQTTLLANAFQTIGHAKRAFVGWYDDIYENGYDYNVVFWRYMSWYPYTSIRDNLVNALQADEVWGYCPIRIWGDVNWNGRLP